MADKQTLLAHIALKFGSHPENIAVEALGYILSESKPALRALENLLRVGGSDVGQISEIRTQDSDDVGGRPDLTSFDENGVERLLIEAKFRAGLTENQPVAYIERLPTDQPSALLFVTPAARFETLWRELRKVVSKSAIELGADRRTSNLQSAAIEGERRLMLTTWKHLLGLMASEAGTAGDSRAKADIRQLLGLTQRMDEDTFVPIRQEELGPEFPHRILSLQRIIEDAVDRGKADKWIDTSRLSTSGSAGGWGRYVRLGCNDSADRAVALFGYSFEFWAKHCNTPLRLRFDGWSGGPMEHREVRRRLEPLLRKDPPKAIYGRDWVRVPIHLQVGVEETAVVDNVVAQLEGIARLIDPEGFAQS